MLGPFSNQFEYSHIISFPTYLIYGEVSNGLRIISCSFAGGDNVSSLGSRSTMRLGETDNGAEIKHYRYHKYREHFKKKEMRQDYDFFVTNISYMGRGANLGGYWGVIGPNNFTVQSKLLFNCDKISPDLAPILNCFCFCIPKQSCNIVL